MITIRGSRCMRLGLSARLARARHLLGEELEVECGLGVEEEDAQRVAQEALHGLHPREHEVQVEAGPLGGDAHLGPDEAVDGAHAAHQVAPRGPPHGCRVGQARAGAEVVHGELRGGGAPRGPKGCEERSGAAQHGAVRDEEVLEEAVRVAQGHGLPTARELHAVEARGVARAPDDHVTGDLCAVHEAQPPLLQRRGLPLDPLHPLEVLALPRVEHTKSHAPEVEVQGPVGAEVVHAVPHEGR
mmetsp:Transcript_24499/g.82261  ORF Transcript_24499/g.82261 Transcript_24499/m.82261 type:complete len:243 (+) Transcript_24499:339-1067(+)